MSLMYRKALLGKVDEDLLKYTSSMEDDRNLVEEVIEILIAHVKYLTDEKLIPYEAGDRIKRELEKLRKNPEQLFDIEAEDIHEAVEIYLNEKLGSIAGYLPLGRSRNDHVAAALRLKTKKFLLEEIKLLHELRCVLLRRAEGYTDAIMPAFTHLQPAQPITFAHYLCHFEEILRDYSTLLSNILDIVDKSPLGSGAVGGTRVPLDREKLGRALFSDIVKNTLTGVSSRDFMYLAGAINASLSTSLSRIAEDMIVFSTPQFDYLIVPEEHLATSSMMPQKRNLATMEIARAWAGKCAGHLVSLLAVHKALPTGYNLDMQEANSTLIEILNGTIATIRIFIDFFEKIEINEKNLRRDTKIYPVLVTDLAEIISLKERLPYREVHKIIAETVKNSGNTEEIYRNIENKFGIKITLREGIEKTVIGSPSPEKVMMCIDKEKEILNYDERSAHRGGGASL